MKTQIILYISIMLFFLITKCGSEKNEGRRENVKEFSICDRNEPKNCLERFEQMHCKLYLTPEKSSGLYDTLLLMVDTLLEQFPSEIKFWNRKVGLLHLTGKEMDAFALNDSLLSSSDTTWLRTFLMNKGVLFDKMGFMDSAIYY
jgi:hypothetical protein